MPVVKGMPVVGGTLMNVDELGNRDRTNVIYVSDHGSASRQM